MAKKASSKKIGKTKKELLDEAIAEAVGAGKELHLESVDFSDPNRPKTCLEVDFPILPINQVAIIEGNAGKPIYQMSKWWARRRSSVFRSMLIAAATKAPDDPGEAAKLVWDSYYGNHQKNEAFKKLKVADIFMGGGTTIVEGARLGMQMFGNDLNPVAWFIVKNELAQVDPTEVQSFLEQIESEVKPQVIPYYACECPRGHKGKWTQRSTGKVMGETFDPLGLKPEERGDYEYEGPEIVYAFWAKHGPCQATGCNHRTPIMSSPVIAAKTLSVRTWKDITCGSCEGMFDVEEQDVRIAPAALFVVSSNEQPFTIRQTDGSYQCPHCNHTEVFSLGKPQNKQVELSLLIHPDWLKGAPGQSPEKLDFGGRVLDSASSTAAWDLERSNTLKHIEVRGTLPEQITCPDTQEVFFTDERGGTVPKKSTFACREGTCGLSQDVLESIDSSGADAAIASYAIHGFCPECDSQGRSNGGRFYAIPNYRAYGAAHRELENSNSLLALLPTEEIQAGLETSVRTPLHKYHYTRWCDFFNARQKLVHCRFIEAFSKGHTRSSEVRDYVAGAYQQYLRNQSLLSFWHLTKDHFAPALSKNNYQPKNTAVEVGVFVPVGYGPWTSTAKPLLESANWKQDPWELLPKALLPEHLEKHVGSTKSVKVHPGDPVLSGASISCGSSTALNRHADQSVDLVITDPPFGDIMQYGELASFFYPWLRSLLKECYSEFSAENPPTSLEAVENLHRHGKDQGNFYFKLLTGCWAEAHRILKPGGLLAFTFHHDKDGPWVSVLESLFSAGFYLEAAFPIRSDETKGEGGTPGTFGAQKVEYDVIHVCRKRIDEPQEISWARLRRQILADVHQLEQILQHHQQAGLQEGDLKVIRRGKALEYYSKHYGKVYVEKGREFTVKEALTGINQLLDDQRDSNAEVPPVNAEPYTRQFLRLFAGTASLARDQMQKFLRGTGVSPAEFEERGWCGEKSKVFHFTSPLTHAQKWKGMSRQGMGRDFDQAMFLIGACYENSGIRVQDTLNSEKFIPHPATSDIIDWFTRHGGDSQMKDAAKLAKQLYTKWVASNEPKIKAAQRTFDFAEEDA